MTGFKMYIFKSILALRLRGVVFNYAQGQLYL
jgi:hypothetical protein